MVPGCLAPLALFIVCGLFIYFQTLTLPFKTTFASFKHHFYHRLAFVVASGQMSILGEETCFEMSVMFYRQSEQKFSPILF